MKKEKQSEISPKRDFGKSEEKMKRKLLYPIAIMASLALALTGCGGSQAKESAKEEKSESKVEAGSERQKLMLLHRAETA